MRRFGCLNVEKRCLTPSLSCHLKTTSKSAKSETLLKPQSIFAFSFALACESIFTNPHSTENRCYRTRKYTVFRRVRVSFSTEILQAGAVKGLNLTRLGRPDCPIHSCRFFSVVIVYKINTIRLRSYFFIYTYGS